MENKLTIKTKWKKIFSVFFTYLFTLLLLISSIFILVRLAPGNPALKYLSPQFNPQLYESVKSNYGIDKSIVEQYFIFMGNVLQGDLGVSYTYRENVQSILFETAPFTIALALVSFLLQIAVSVSMVLYLHKHKGRWFETAINRISLSMYSLPTMVVGIGLIFTFSIMLKVFPLSDVVSINYDELNLIQKIIDLVKHLTLPLITLSLPGIIIFYNYMRENVEATEKRTYIKFLLANGFEKETVFKKHVLPNSLNPLISILGTELGILLGGAVVTESIFGLPGLGRLTVSAILTRDYPLIVGCVLFSGMFVLLANLVANLYSIRRDVRLKQSYNTNA